MSESESNDACLELALEGEKLCKTGNCRDGAAFFEAALQTGTDDLRTLSAIYSQLGNAYFYMGDYVKAMRYHKHDLTMARTTGDRLGEAKASGNLGNTLKVMGKFEEAVVCCRRHLEICREHGDRVGEGRALYNLGNVYHAKGKHIGRLGHQDPGEFPEEVKSLFEKAVRYYGENKLLMTEIGDRAAQGRACGNLGNVHYLLGNFGEAVDFHEERLKIAKEFGDRSAERRAHSNLGNARIFLGEFEKAAGHYKKTLTLARELGDRAVEAQACYSLGNTYTLLKDYPSAIEYHLRHLFIAQELLDKVGEGRACWSLGNAHSAMGNHEEAYRYATRHLEISKDTGDRMGQATAQLNLAELSKTLQQTETSTTSLQSRRLSMEQMDLLQITPKVNGKEAAETADQTDNLNKSGIVDEEDFFDFISRFQSKRMDDQRCSFVAPNVKSKPKLDDKKLSALNHEMGNLKQVPFLPGLSNKQPELLQRLSIATNNDDHFPDESFFEMLMKCQGSRIEEQRSSLPNEDEDEMAPLALPAPTVPDEDFFSLITRLQGERLEDQRANLPNERI